MALRLGLFGALGVEAEVLLTRLGEAELELASLSLFASDGEGETQLWQGRARSVMDPSRADFSALDVAIFLDPMLAESHLEDAQAAGITVLDATGVLFSRGEAPLFMLGMTALPGPVLAIADAVTSHVATFLDSLPRLPQRLSLAVNLPVSSHGQTGIDALASESARLLNGQPLESFGLGQQIAFNVLPNIEGSLAADVEDQLRSLLGESCEVLCHTVMTVPVFYGHTLSIVCTFGGAVDMSAVRGALSAQPRLRFYPNEDCQAASAALSHDSLAIDVAELSLDKRDEKILRCTLVGDNLRDGVVSNLVAALQLI